MKKPLKRNSRHTSYASLEEVGRQKEGVLGSFLIQVKEENKHFTLEIKIKIILA